MPSRGSGRMGSRFVARGALLLALASFVPGELAAQEQAQGGNEKPIILGVKIRGGARYDNVRMCVATAPGKQGGPTADVSLFAEIALSKTVGVDFDVPLFRPVLFALSFEMLQFEPSMTLKFRKVGQGRIDLIAGPMLGLSLHYGPDYRSASSGSDRTDSFFAMGPIVGGYGGLDFKRPGKLFNFQLGLTPYAEALFGVRDPRDHRGVVAGALLDFQFRFGSPGPEPKGVRDHP